MNYDFFPYLSARSPVYSYQDYPAEDYAKLLQADFFKMALYIASPDFYNELKKKDFFFDNLSPAQKNTLKKYYNRACYRAVPFGAFSSVSVVSWASDAGMLMLQDEVNVRVKIDYLSSLAICGKLIGNEARETVMYRSNTSLYKVHGNFRYIKYEQDGHRLKRAFSIVSLSKDKVITALLDFCSVQKNIGDIIGFLSKMTGADNEAIIAFVDQLIAEQIITPQAGMNITGNDGLEELIQSLGQKNIYSDEVLRVRALLNGLSGPGVSTFSSVPVYGNLLKELLNHPENFKNPFYVVSERFQVGGGVHIKYQKVILDALHCLNRLTPHYKNEALDNFKSAYTGKFENRELPLLFVLDPEVGIGYENLEDVFIQHSLMKDIQFGDITETTAKFLKWTPIHSLLLNKLQSLRDKKDPAWHIEIADEDLAGIVIEQNDFKYPPSLSVMFRVIDERVYVESAGGASATALIGRFSSFGEDFYAIAKNIAEKEQAMNNEVIFAEIAHACESHTDNINRRKHIREFEIPVIVMSTMTQSTQISLSDLYVSVNNNQIILRSRKLNAIIVPRLSSAFNYSNSELSVFRFLCDLQYQGLKLNFKLDLEDFFPGLSFYPRVLYKSAILCLAKWHLKAKDFSFLKSTASVEWYNHFLKLADLLSLPKLFALSQNDNHLVFDRDNRDDILLFLDTIKNYESLVLTEYIIDTSGALHDAESRGKPVICQYVAPLYLKDTVYGISGNMVFDDNGSNNRFFMPGTEWLYFKIYCHPSWSNELLYDILYPVLNNAVNRKYIDKWFYVRYTDPDYHIRLRVHITNNSTGNIISLFSNKLKGLLNEGIIERYYVDTYIRELERYTPALMEDVETFFYHSSVLMLQYFRHARKTGTEYSYNLDIIIQSTDAIMNAFGLEVEAKALLLQKLYTSMSKEFGDSKNLKKSLEKKYLELRQEMNIIYETIQQKGKTPFLQCRNKLQAATAVIARKVKKKKSITEEKILSDLLHMHLNRLFIQNPRKQEMIVYFLLCKLYNAVYYREKSVSR